MSSDISVLKTMLAQEGLTKNDFSTGGKMMSEELKDFQTAPTLTLNPFAEEEKAQPEVKKESL